MRGTFWNCLVSATPRVFSLFRLLLRQSGGQLDYSQLANLSGLSRPTVKAHIEAMQIAHAVHLLRPFHGGGKREIVSRPKCYAFDTGFVTFEKGWDSIRDDDRGLLWEHLVLDSLRFRFADENIFYWQDKSRREVDFVIRRGRDRVDVLERGQLRLIRRHIIGHAVLGLARRIAQQTSAGPSNSSASSTLR